MKFGASTFIWTSPFGDDRLHLCRHVAALGFDVIEVCVEDPARLFLAPGVKLEHDAVAALTLLDDATRTRVLDWAVTRWRKSL